MKKLYQGSKQYVASPALVESVNVALTIGRPLLIKGEPGTGKTVLAKSIAEELGMPFLRWNIKSTSKAQEGLYLYDTVQRLNDSRFGDADVSDISRYIKLGKLGEAFTSPHQALLLIDEIDKADLEFPNDLLAELDEMRFYIHETKQEIVAQKRPFILITSNAEKELPDPFLRRCVFHYIDFPDAKMMSEIVKVHFPDIDSKMLKYALEKFYHLRAMSHLKKAPSTSELLDWLEALIGLGLDPKTVEKQMPLLGCLLKNEADLPQVYF